MIVFCSNLSFIIGLLVLNIIFKDGKDDKDDKYGVKVGNENICSIKSPITYLNDCINKIISLID